MIFTIKMTLLYQLELALAYRIEQQINPIICSQIIQKKKSKIFYSDFKIYDLSKIVDETGNVIMVYYGNVDVMEDL